MDRMEKKNNAYSTTENLQETTIDLSFNIISIYDKILDKSYMVFTKLMACA